MHQILLQNATANLLQNATEVYYKMPQVFITKCDIFTKCHSYLKNCDDFITKCDSCYKMGRLLQIEPVHGCSLV